MVNLTKASTELFRRTPDERFDSLNSLLVHCNSQREASQENWLHVSDFDIVPDTHSRSLEVACQNGSAAYSLNDWSFSQLCKLNGIDKQTANRVKPETASAIFGDTMPGRRQPLQIYTVDDQVRAVHGTGYTRLYNKELLQVVAEIASDFSPPPKGLGGATGLYCGEQDMFCFCIDPEGWVDIQGEQFAPGFFVWNSEVGRRSLGIQTFWFQRICENHIVWDATEVFELKRRHLGNVDDSLSMIRQAIENLVSKRDERRDTFAAAIGKAMATPLGQDAEEVQKVLIANGIGKRFAEQATALSGPNSAFSIFSMVDALTRIAGRYDNAGDRLTLDLKAARLLSLAA